MGRGTDTASGAATGAATGAAIGSVVPGWGTAIGAGVGAVAGGAIGYFGSGESEFDRQRRLFGEVDRRNFDIPGFGAQMGQYSSLAGQYGGRNIGGALIGQQGQHTKLLQDEANGRGIGQQLVRHQAQGMADRNTAQQYGMAAAARPGQQAMAARNMALGSAIGQSAVGEQAANAGGQVALGAQGQLGQHLAGMRSAATADQQTNDQAQLEALRQRMALSGAQQQGGMAYEQLRMGGYSGALQRPTDYDSMLGAMQGAGSAYLSYRGTQRPGNGGKPT